jgi:DNA-binding NtrC family response regulator
LIGRVPLKELIRDAADIIEKMCIEAALRQTGNNRASAADLLGLSRQSLYLKLRRYNLEEFTG